MRPISPKTKKILLQDVFMKCCCLCGRTPVEWHHQLEYQGRQSDDPKSILPLCKGCHSGARNKFVKEELDYQMLVRRGLDVSLYPKAGLLQRKKYLIIKYGN